MFRLECFFSLSLCWSLDPFSQALVEDEARTAKKRAKRQKKKEKLKNRKSAKLDGKTHQQQRQADGEQEELSSDDNRDPQVEALD